MWNGRILLMHKREFAGTTLRGQYFETDFAEFRRRWRDFGSTFAGHQLFRARCAAGLGRRLCAGRHGRAYDECRQGLFFRWHADPNDIVGTRVDLELSVRREVEERQGLAPAHFEIDAGCTACRAGIPDRAPQPMRAAETAAAYCARDHGSYRE